MHNVSHLGPGVWQGREGRNVGLVVGSVLASPPSLWEPVIVDVGGSYPGREFVAHPGGAVVVRGNLGVVYGKVGWMGPHRS